MENPFAPVNTPAQKSENFAHGRICYSDASSTTPHAMNPLNTCDAFTVARLPRIEFGAGRRARIATIARSFGTHALVVSGASSFASSSHWPRLCEELSSAGVRWQHLIVAEEPSPELVDEAVALYRTAAIDAVIGIGGGSALDAAKAIAGLLRPGNSVLDHLEGVGPELPYRGPAVPFIAVPTTAGTGSEATRNAVLSRSGPHGFKKSFRDDKLVAEWAIVDPDLLASCPPRIIAANGMDALTQLMESYVSTRANPFTDALALDGMARIAESLLDWHRGEGDLDRHRHNMAYAALLSGITLAQVGLGSVHGLAAPLGAFHAIPHGVACGMLLEAATRTNLEALRQRAPHSPAQAKYARVGRVLGKRPDLDEDSARALLLETLAAWTESLDLGNLGQYGVDTDAIPHLVANSRGSSMKTNPVELSDTEIADTLRTRL